MIRDSIAKLEAKRDNLVRFLRVLRRDNVQRLVLFANERRKLELMEILESDEHDTEDLNAWSQTVATENNLYECLYVDTLRGLCRKRGIPNYQSLRKMELIFRLQEDDDERTDAPSQVF